MFTYLKPEKEKKPPKLKMKTERKQMKNLKICVKISAS